jgi:hypothetical protein
MTAASLDPTRSPWPPLAELLLQEFPEASISDVVRELRGARDDVDLLELSDDETVTVAAAHARRRLSILTGHLPR